MVRNFHNFRNSPRKVAVVAALARAAARLTSLSRFLSPVSTDRITTAMAIITAIITTTAAAKCRSTR